MSELKYTKGEWYWSLDENGKPFNLRSKLNNGDFHVLYISKDFLGENSLLNLADAKIIAQSPAMYELLKRIKSLIDSGDWKLQEGFYETEVNWLNSILDRIENP